MIQIAAVACAVGHGCGAQLVEEQVTQRQSPPAAPLCRDNDDGYNEWLGMSREDRRHWMDSYKKW